MSWIKNLFGGPLSVKAAADHLELGDNHTVLGLKIDWKNSTKDTVFVDKVDVYLGHESEPLIFSPLERFTRVAGQRAFQRSPVVSLVLPPKRKTSEQIRFLHQGALDIPAGSYDLEVQITDLTRTCYKSRTKLKIESRISFVQRRNGTRIEGMKKGWSAFYLLHLKRKNGVL